MTKFISWRRVSTKKQGKSGLGFLAQRDIINYFVNLEHGKLIADYQESYTGKDLTGCKQLRKAIAHCKEVGATLIIAKTDRFRNTIEALQIYEEMNGKAYFCDLPHTDKFTLTLFFALAEREALMVSIRTKAALKAKKERDGSWSDEYGKNTGTTRNSAGRVGGLSSGANRKVIAKNNPNNVLFEKCLTSFEKMNDCRLMPKDNVDEFLGYLNNFGAVTSRGLPFNVARVKATLQKIRKNENIITH
jgi:hypothetical protein